MWRSVSKLYCELVNDEVHARLAYRLKFGRPLDLRNPVRFTEKLWWLKLYNRAPLLTICADKYRVREYVRDRGLEHTLTKLYAVYDRASEIEWEQLPPKAFLKTNHGSGFNVLWDRRRPIDTTRVQLMFEEALKFNYYWRQREWCYKDIPPKIIVEEVLDQEPFLVDYRFLCFDGKVKLIFVDIETADSDGGHNPRARRNVYDRDFNLLSVRVGREPFDASLVKRPDNLDEMVTYAETLAEPFPHCRVDLYNIDGKIRFGEITFYHAAGLQAISPDEWDIRMGSWINLASSKIVRT